MSTTTTTTEPTPNKYIYDEFAGIRGEKYLNTLAELILTQAQARTWRAAMMFQAPGKQLYAGADKISEKTRPGGRKIYLDMQSLQRSGMMARTHELVTEKQKDGSWKRFRAAIKDFSYFYHMAHEYHLWLQDKENYIEPTWDNQDFIKQLDEPTKQKLMRFDVYRRILTQNKPGRKRKTPPNSYMAPQASSQDEKLNNYFFASSPNRNSSGNVLNSIENSNSVSIFESLLNGNGNSISDLEKERVRTSIPEVTKEQAFILSNFFSPEQLRVMVGTGYKQASINASDSHTLQSKQTSKHDYTTGEQIEQTFNYPPTQSNFPHFEEIAPKQAISDNAERYAESIGEPEGSGPLRYASSIDDSHRQYHEMVRSQAQEHILQRAEHKRQKWQRKQCWNEQQKEEHARREAYRGEVLALYFGPTVKKLSLQFSDEEPRSSLKLVRDEWQTWKERGLSERGFNQLLEQCRDIVSHRAIRKRTKDGKQVLRMPYFLKCLHNEIEKYTTPGSGYSWVDSQNQNETEPEEYKVSDKLMDELGYYPQDETEPEATTDNSVVPTVTSAAEEDDQGWPVPSASITGRLRSKGMNLDDIIFEQENEIYHTGQRIVRQVNKIEDGVQVDAASQSNYAKEGQSLSALRTRIGRELLDNSNVQDMAPQTQFTISHNAMSCKKCKGIIFYHIQGPNNNRMRMCAHCQPSQKWDQPTRQRLLSVINSIPTLDQVKAMIEKEQEK